MELVAARGLPLTPAFTADGESVIYTEADENERFGLWRISTRGGPVEEIADPGLGLRGAARPASGSPPAGRKDTAPVPARLEVLDPGGHPAVVPGDFPHFDGTHGRIYLLLAGRRRGRGSGPSGR